MHHAQQTEGIVLRRVNVGEADRLVTLLTPEGKMTTRVRGVRRITSRKASSLDLLQRISCSLRHGQGLPTIEEAFVRHPSRRLREDLVAFVRACWATELADHFLEEGTGGTLYPSFIAYLERIEEGSTPLDGHVFELKVMEELGWHPELLVCARCHQSLEPSRIAWSVSAGGVIDDSCAELVTDTERIDPETVKLLRLLVDHGFGVTLRLNVAATVVRQAEELLYNYVTFHGERRWRTPTIFAQESN